MFGSAIRCTGEFPVQRFLPTTFIPLQTAANTPTHSNTRTTPTGIKTRHFSSILSEVSSALRIHQQHGSFLGGVHLELTGDAVTECVGGSEGLVEEDLSLNYTTYCDPRLNEKQALELAFLVAGHYRDRRPSVDF